MDRRRVDMLRTVEDPACHGCSSALSILSVIYSSRVLCAFSSTPSTSPPLMFPTTVHSYIDDFSLFAIGADTTDALCESLSVIQLHLQSIGMNIDPSKLELVRFSQRHHPHLHRPLVTENLTIMLSLTVRQLSIFFDTKLPFH